MKKHIVVFKGSSGEEVLSGKKNIECWFSTTKKPPFGIVSSGDLVFIKPSGKDIIGQFRVKKVIFYDNVDVGDLRYLGEEFAEVPKSRYLTLIFIGECTRFITSPLKVKKTGLKSWMVLD